MRKVNPEKHQEKKSGILKAAARCFARSGFRGASISDICEEAGIRSGHLYHYFDGKEAIVEAMVEAGLAQVAAEFARLENDPDPLAPVRSELQKFVRRAAAGERAIAIEILAEAARNPKMERIVRRHTKRMRELLGGSLRRAQEAGSVDPELDPYLAAGLLISLFEAVKTLPIRSFKVNGAQTLELLDTLVTRFLVIPAEVTSSR